MACAVLHNLCRRRRIQDDDDEEEDYEDEDGAAADQDLPAFAPREMQGGMRQRAHVIANYFAQ